MSNQPLFEAPRQRRSRTGPSRTWFEFLHESQKAGWLSFTEDEVVGKLHVVDGYRDGIAIVYSASGTRLGIRLEDHSPNGTLLGIPLGDRYLVNIAAVAGRGL